MEISPGDSAKETPSLMCKPAEPIHAREGNRTFRNRNVQIAVQKSVTTTVSVWTPRRYHCPVLKSPAWSGTGLYAGSMNKPAHAQRHKRVSEVVSALVQTVDIKTKFH